jgi:hypothetical protein
MIIHTLTFKGAASRPSWSSASSRRRTGGTGGSGRVQTGALKDNFARLSKTTPPESIAKVVVRDSSGAEITTIPNADGKRASLGFFAHLAQKHGGVVARGASAEEGLALYDEVTDEAKAHRGSHPNIDLLLDVQSGAVGPLTVEVIEA